MASRVNTRFLLILLLVGTAAVAIVGGLWYVKNRTDVTRSLKRGDEFVEQGEFLKARSFYARALSRDPGNLAYLDKVKGALLQVRPDTADVARELYTSYISTLRHAAEHHPTDAAQHLPLLKELHTAARRSSSWGYSELLAESADYMLSRAAKSHPDYPKGKLYRGVAYVSPWMLDRLAENEIASGEKDIEEFLEVMPDSDLGWSSLILARLQAYDRLVAAGQQTRADEMHELLMDTIASAREAVTDGPELMIATLTTAINEHRLDPKSLDMESVKDDVARLIRLLDTADDATVIAQGALVLERLYWFKDRPDAIEVLDRFLARSPDAHDCRLLRATLLYHRGRLDEAEAEADTIINSELMTVSFLSQLQFEMKRRAKSLRVDTAVRRWDLEQDESKRTEMLARIEKAQDDLMEVIADKEADPLLIRARGQVAFVKRDYGLAAALFTRLVSESTSVDYRTRLYAALSLEQTGELGAAVEMLAQANEEQPGNVPALLHEARLRQRMNQFEEARALVAQVQEVDPNNEEARAVLLAISRETEGGDMADPIADAMSAATDAFRSGEYDVARSTIIAALEKAPNDLSLLNGMVRVEMAASQTDEARKYIDRALVISPKSRTFLRYKANIDNPDRIDAIKQYMTDLYTDETERSVETLLALSALRMRDMRVVAANEASTDPQPMDDIKSELERVIREEAAFRAKAEQLAPNNPRLIEYRFMTAIVASDWDEAEAVIDLAERLNTDQANGALYRGRYAAARERPEEAAQMFQLSVERIPWSGMAWRLLALSQRFLGNYDESLSAFERSYANNPNDVSTATEYGKLLDLTGNKGRALLVIRQARRLAPNNSEIRDIWLTLEAEAGEPAVVLRERQRLYEANPDDKRNGAALARFLGTTEPIRELLLDDEGEERYTFDRWARLPATGPNSPRALLAQEQADWYREADEITESLAAPEERRLDWHLLRSGLLRARGEIDAGEAVLRGWAARQTEPESQLDAFLALGLYQAEVARTPEAIANYEKALTFDSEQKHKPHLALAELYFDIGRYGDAIPHFEAVLASSPSRQLKMQIIEAYIKTDQLQQARERLADLEATSSPDGTSLMLKASLTGKEADELWAQGDRQQAEAMYAEHVETLEMASAADPTNPMPHVLQAVALFRKYQRTGNAVLLDDAMIALTRGDDVQPGFPQTSLTRVQILREKDDNVAAINELTRLVERAPNRDDARRLLVQMLLIEGRTDVAIDAVKEAVEINPSAVFWVVALADLYVQDLRKAEADLADEPRGSRTASQLRLQVKRLSDSVARQYTAAVELKPTAQLIGKYSEVLLENSPPAYKQVIALSEKHAEEVEKSPTLRCLYARAISATGKRDEALEHMTIAYEKYKTLIAAGDLGATTIARWYQELFEIFGPDDILQAEAFAMKACKDDPNTYELRAIANIWATRGMDGMSRSIELRQRAIDLAPADDVEHMVGLQRDLGRTMILTKQYRKALEAYEKVLDVNPDDGNVLNNVAYIYSEFLGEPENGLAYAERAAEILPNDASVMDTLGWIYFRLNKFELAEDCLRKAGQLQPTAENQLHLAGLFVEKGDYRLASRHLQKASELNPNRKIEEEINRLADDIRTKSEGR